jgi:hypothetical protein
MESPANIKTWLRGHLSDSQYLSLKHLYGKHVHAQDLPRLARIFETDKESWHFYGRHYQEHFQALRLKNITLLEIGVGGYKNPARGGHSLRMWKTYFPNGRINGIDLLDKSAIEEPRIRTFAGNQVDEVFLKRVIAEIGTPDIIIDDGSHRSEHVIASFKILFPLLNPDGIYVVEDLQTSYWGPETSHPETGQEWGGSSDLNASHTSMNFMKSLVDSLNYEEFTIPGYTPSYFDRHIVAMHFYHNLAFIQKGMNNEGSNKFGKR